MKRTRAKARQGRRPQGTRAAIERFVQTFARLLHGEKVNATTLAAGFEVSTKTIHRDLAFMRDRLRLPMAYDAPRFSWVLTDECLPWWLQRPGDAGFPTLPRDSSKMLAEDVASYGGKP